MGTQREAIRQQARHDMGENSASLLLALFVLLIGCQLGHTVGEEHSSRLKAAVNLDVSTADLAASSTVPAQWEGSFNSTFAKSTSGSDPASAQEGCATALPAKISNGCTATTRCTSCKDGYTLNLVNHKSMAGNCRNGSAFAIPQVWGTKLDKNAGNENPNEKNVLCNKIGSEKQVVHVNSIKNSTIKSAMRDAKGKDNKALVTCSVWKQTICRGSACTVHKEIQCVEICQLDPNNGGAEGGRSGINCQTELCVDHGEYMCKGVGMMA